MTFNNVTIIGTGLLGCSLALSLKKNKLSKNIIGLDINDKHSKAAFDKGIIDEYCIYTNHQSAIMHSDWIVLCVPVGTMAQTMADIAPFVSQHSIISDVGSTKQSTIQAAIKNLSATQLMRFIPLHPIAGSDKHGPNAAVNDLFVNKPLIITPLNCNKEIDIINMQNLWQTIGSNVKCMSAKEHDDIFAVVSHLPHVLSFAFMDYLISLDNKDAYLDIAGSGFKDFTRIAGSSHIIWKDICFANKNAILQHLKSYIQNLNELYVTIENQDSKLGDIFKKSSLERQKLNNK